MTPRQIEAWAIRVLELVENKQNVEDTRVELKTEWPTEMNKVARQIGGHANAARGEPILWLIGVDERAGKVIGAPPSEFANWYPAVGKEFEGTAPECIHLNVPHNGVTVPALLFETDRALSWSRTQHTACRAVRAGKWRLRFRGAGARARNRQSARTSSSY